MTTTSYNNRGTAPPLNKGMTVTVNMIVIIIFVVIAALVLFLLWGGFAAQAGKPVSNTFYQLFDWIAGLIPS